MATDSFRSWYSASSHVAEADIEEIFRVFQGRINIQATLNADPLCQPIVTEFRQRLEPHMQQLPPLEGYFVAKTALDKALYEIPNIASILRKRVASLPDYMTYSHQGKNYFPYATALILYLTYKTQNLYGEPSVRPLDITPLDSAARGRLLLQHGYATDSSQEGEDDDEDSDTDPATESSRAQREMVKIESSMNLHREAPPTQPGITSLAPIIIDGEEYLLLNDIKMLPECQEREYRIDELLYMLQRQEDIEEILDRSITEVPREIAEPESYQGRGVSDLEAYSYFRNRIPEKDPIPDDDEFAAIQERLGIRNVTTNILQPGGTWFADEPGKVSNLRSRNLIKEDYDDMMSVPVDTFAGRKRASTSQAEAAGDKGAALKFYLPSLTDGRIAVIHTEFSPRGREAFLFLIAITGFGRHSKLYDRRDHAILVKRSVALQVFDFAIPNQRQGRLAVIAAHTTDRSVEELAVALKGGTSREVLRNLGRRVGTAQINKFLEDNPSYR